MEIWENFDKKELKKGFDFSGQVIYQGKLEEFSIRRDGENITISFDHGYINLSLKEFLESII